MLAIFKWVFAVSLCPLCSASSINSLSACSREGLVDGAGRVDACASAANADLAPSAGSLIQIGSKPRKPEESVHRNIREKPSLGQVHRNIREHSALGQILRSAASKPKAKAKSAKKEKGASSSSSSGSSSSKGPEPASTAPKKPSSGKTSDGYPWEPLLDEDYVRDSSSPFDNSKYKVSMAGKEAKPKKEAKSKKSESKSKESSKESEKSELAASAAGAEAPGVDETGLPNAALYPPCAGPCPANPCPNGPGGGMNIVSLPNCVTQEHQGGLTGLGIGVAEPGTPCLFGLDVRDGGGHCIIEGEKYGTYGWCYTKKDKSQWGSCADSCPAHGYDAVIAKREESLDLMIMEAIEEIDQKTHPCETEEKGKEKGKAKGKKKGKK